MGGSKKSAKPPPKKESKYKIPTVFNCPKCGGKGTVSIQIKRSSSLGLVHCAGECTRMNTYGNYDDDENDFSEMDARPGQKRQRAEAKAIYECNILRLEEPVDVFFKYYESYRREREAITGPQDEAGPAQLVDEDNWDALREAGEFGGSSIRHAPIVPAAATTISQPLAAGRRRAASEDDDEDDGLLLERDDNQFTEGYEFGEGLN